MMKRVAIGVVFAAGLALGAWSHPFAQSDAASARSVDDGRYRIVFSPHARADTFLLDTRTGRIWQQTMHSAFQGDPVAWDAQDRIDDEAGARAFAGHQVRK